jgi:hypothetical protein
MQHTRHWPPPPPPPTPPPPPPPHPPPTPPPPPRPHTHPPHTPQRHQDRTLRLWNPAKGLFIKAYKGHGYEVRDVSVAADNSKLASVGGDRQVCEWCMCVPAQLVAACLQHARGSGSANADVAGTSMHLCVPAGVLVGCVLWRRDPQVQGPRLAHQRGEQGRCVGPAQNRTAAASCGACNHQALGRATTARPCCTQVVHAASDEVLVTGGYDAAVKVWDCRSHSQEPIQTMRQCKVRAPLACARVFDVRAAAHALVRVFDFRAAAHAPPAAATPTTSRQRRARRMTSPAWPRCRPPSSLAAWTARCGASTCAWGAPTPTRCTTPWPAWR